VSRRSNSQQKPLLSSIRDQSAGDPFLPGAEQNDWIIRIVTFVTFTGYQLGIFSE
jgi:hypothetical protein